LQHALQNTPQHTLQQRYAQVHELKFENNKSKSNTTLEHTLKKTPQYTLQQRYVQVHELKIETQQDQSQTQRCNTH